MTDLTTVQEYIYIYNTCAYVPSHVAVLLDFRKVLRTIFLDAVQEALFFSVSEARLSVFEARSCLRHSVLKKIPASRLVASLQYSMYVFINRLFMTADP